MFFSFICCVFLIQLHAQQCRLIIYDEKKTVLPNNNFQFQSTFSTKEICLAYAAQLPSLLSTKGFISASVDSLWQDSANVYIQLYTGEKYEWNNIEINEKDWSTLNNLNYTKTTFARKPFQQQKLTEVYNDVLTYFANNGHPFAKVFLDSISLNNNKISARLNIDSGAFYKMDSIIVNGDAKISGRYLQRYLGIEKAYQQNNLSLINERLSRLTFLKQSQSWNVEMLNTGAILHLYLEATTNNEVNVLVGLLPQNAQTGGKLLLTGEARVALQNSFGTGETIGVNWQQLQPESPQLNILFQRPYIFSSAFGLNLNFNLYKRDSSFVTINAQTGLVYELSSNQTGAILLQTFTTNVLNVDTVAVRLNKTLPNVADVSYVNLALQYNFYSTDYRFNPRSGNELSFSGSFGKKRIKKNNAVIQIKDPSFNYNDLYDSVKLNSYQVKVQLNASHYIPLGKQSTLKLGLNSGWFQTPDYFQNELFRIGGFRLLRGFNEESIYTNLYLIGTAEYRLLLAKNSWFYSFTDVGSAQYKSNNQSINHTYIGFGGGLALETKSGIFNISVAEGKRNDLKLDFRQSKIHLGFISLF